MFPTPYRAQAVQQNVDRALCFINTANNRKSVTKRILSQLTDLRLALGNSRVKWKQSQTTIASNFIHIT
jgi:hypothetical protein